jgi:hypothetical protein
VFTLQASSTLFGIHHFPEEDMFFETRRWYANSMKAYFAAGF